MQNQPKKLYRSKTDRRLAGVCGGIAEYFGVDSNITRLAWLFISILTGVFPGIVVYIIAIFIVPEQTQIQ